VLRAPVGHRTPGGLSPELSRWAEPPPSTCWPHFCDAAQDVIGLLGCEDTLPGHSEVLINQHPQVFLLSHSRLLSFLPQAR